MELPEFLVEADPKVLVFSFIGALVSLVVIKNVETPIIFKILTPIATFIACYIVTSIQFKD